MQLYTSAGANVTAESIERLYQAMVDKFGHEKAWEFILTFYKGAGCA